MMKTKAVKYDHTAYQLMQGDTLVGIALALSNGRWLLTDPNERRVPGFSSFRAPQECAVAFDTVSA